MDDARESCISMVGDIGLAYAETIIPPLQRWADWHPAETWLERLQKALPECELANIVNPHCPGEFFADAPGRENCPYEEDLEGPVRCDECWNQEAKDG